MVTQKNSLIGLTDSEVEESRKLHGANVLTPPKKDSLFSQLLKKFKDPLIIILLVAGVLSIGISLYEYFYLKQGGSVFFEPVGIFIAIFLATGLAFYFEMKAEREFQVLNKVNDDEPVQVVRNGNTIEIPKKDVVTGDVVIITTGEEIPADGELIDAVTLSVDESTLTGEPIAEKTTDPERFDQEATFPSNHVMRGTKVMEGHGVMKVFAVGDHTENGKVFKAATIDDSVKTPLNEQLERLGTLVSRASYTIGVLIVVGRLIQYYFATVGEPFDLMAAVAYFLQTVMIAVTLIVVAVPEGLPMAVNLSLAYSMRRMLKTNNLVRKMHACETMGATTVICTDKTGTLTQNQMQVAETQFFGLGKEQKLGDDEMSRLIATGIAVNSTAQLDLTDRDKPKVLGNPTEGALILWLRANELDYRSLRAETEVVEELPFTTERKYMATVIKDKVTGKRILFVKGAPEIVMSLCKTTVGDVSKDKISQMLLGFQNQAMRTLGFAYLVLKDGQTGISESKVVADNLTMLGVTAISDPVRADVPAAVKEVTDAGIAVKIVTGDTPATAKEIGRQIGLWNDTDGDKNIITGPEFAALTDAELDDRVMDLKIIARARPMDKKRLVESLQRHNQVVAVTGDGTNDAPALKAAHVGLSMGDGTSVAKEASDITIIDNSFASIGRAVMWGRSLYRNIQRFILFQMTVNVAACLIVLAGAFMGTESPLTVTQMLWVNLIMDTFAAMALASLPPSRKVMEDKPRDRRKFIINRPMWNFIIGVGLAFFVILLWLLHTFETYNVPTITALFSHEPQPAGQPTLSAIELSMFFTIFVFMQFWNMFNARAFGSETSALNLKGCSEFNMIVLLIFVGQLVIVNIGGSFFNVCPISLIDWVVILGLTSLVLWIGELARMIRRCSKK